MIIKNTINITKYMYNIYYGRNKRTISKYYKRMGKNG